jgi:signal transduction histidine kinase
MRLPRFILAHSEQILQAFEDFARTHTSAGEGMDISALRDHAASMLTAIASDIQEPQSEHAQVRKSRGDAPDDAGGGPTAAEQHGTDRAGRGFTLEEMFSEYRALRASVLKLWAEERGQLEETDFQDLIRFNEAIDQALAESIERYSAGVAQSREMFLAILGHDLRTPLSAVLTASSFLVTEGELTGTNFTLAARIQRSGERMHSLVGDLLDLTRSRLGRGIPITPAAADIGRIAADAIEEIGAHHSDREITFETRGDLQGEWDEKRVAQALSNVIGNAVQHGAEGPITVTACGEADEVVVAVHNVGPAIPGEDLPRIFNSFTRAASGNATGVEQGSLGLGLYIAQQIAISHGGWIDVRSSEEHGTVFELRMPRHAPVPDVPTASPGDPDPASAERANPPSPPPRRRAGD